MARVYVSIGSNIDRERQITIGLDALSERFGELQISPVYESIAVGFDGDPFLNLVVGLECDLPVGALAQLFREIEARAGRDRSQPKFSARTLDLDILTYDDCCGVIDGVELPRDEIVKYAFVLCPLADVAPDTRHPQVGHTFGQLWQQFSGDRQALWPVPFLWQGRDLSA